MTCSRSLIGALCLSAVILFSGCSDADRGTDEAGLIARVGNATLTRSEFVKAMPGGMTPADSVRFAQAYIHNWIKSRLVTEIAADEIDMTNIDRLVDEYRSRLIELEYRKQMFETHVRAEIPEDTLRNYFVSNNSDFILQRPMLQGLYLKVPSDARNLGTIRKLYRSDKQADIDRLEKEVLTSAIHYDYFRDRWVDWEQIELHIPYDFGNNPDAFLRDKDHFETSAGGFVYLLDIKDKLQTGATMPYETARPLIVERLRSRLRADYEKTLLDDLYKNSLDKGRIQLFVDLEP